MASAVDSVIHDLGYQRYQGPRLGRWYANRSLYVHGLRTAFGLGRGAKSKIFPWSVASIVGLIAVVLAAIESQTGKAVVTYPEFCDEVTLLTVMFCAAAAPELISRDLGTRVLTLYFARPVRSTDYAIARLAALVSAVWLLLAVPLTLMFAGAAFSTDDGMSGVWDTAVDFGRGLLFAAMHAMVIGSIAVLTASATKRRAFSAAMVVGVFLVTLPVVGALQTLGGGNLPRLAPLGSPLTLLPALGRWLFGGGGPDVGGFGPLYALVCVAIVAASVGLLLLRYRRTRA